MSKVLVLAAALDVTCVLGASLGPRQVGWKDHYFRPHPSARRNAAKIAAKRKAEFEEKRKLMTVENAFGAGYYYGGEDSSTWLVNGERMSYADVDCDWAPGWFQKLDSLPDTNPVTAGPDSVCATEQTPKIGGGTIPCALICLPYQYAVSGATSQDPSFMMPAEDAGAPSWANPTGVKAGVSTPAAPLVNAQDGYDLGYLAYGMAAPDPFGEGPICPDIARSVEDCTYSTEETRKFTKGGVEMKYPRHAPLDYLGDGSGLFDRASGGGTAADGVCSKSDQKTQWLDCGIPCPAPYPMTDADLSGSYGVGVIVFMVVCTLLGLVALMRVGKKAENYFVAGRSLNLFVVTATLGSQCIDSGTALGTLDLGYLYHYWDGAAIPIGLGLSLVLNSIFFAYPLNKMKLLTLPDLMARKFGPACEIAFSFFSILSFCCLLGGNLVGAGKIICHLFFGGQAGMEVPGIWICAFAVWLYTVAGGLFSVAYTDIGQALVGWTGMLVGAIYVMNTMPAAPGVSPAYPLGDKPAFAEQLTNADALDPIPNAIVLNWATIIVLAFGNLGALDFQARVFAAKGPKTAVAGCFLAGCIAFIIGAPFAHIPGAVRALYGPSSPHAEFVADSCSRHITVLGCFGPGAIDFADPGQPAGCSSTNIAGCDPTIRKGFCNAIPMNTPTCGEWKPDRYAPLKFLTCSDPTCHGFTDYLGDSGLGHDPGWMGNFPMPGFLGGWMLLAIIAASMSTGDGAILAMGTVLGHNIVSKFGVPKDKLLTTTRISTLFWALVSGGIASAVPGQTGYLLIVAFDIMFAGCVVPMFAAVYWKGCKPIAAFISILSGSFTRFILEFALSKDGLLLLVGTYAETFAAGLYEYPDFKKFTDWDLITGAINATEYGAAGKQEVCPQRKLEDWTGFDSLVSPCVSLLALIIAQLVVPDIKHAWFTPVPGPEDETEAKSTNKEIVESAAA